MTDELKKELDEALEELRSGASAHKLFSITNNGNVVLRSNPDIVIESSNVIADEIKDSLYNEFEERYNYALSVAEELATLVADSDLTEDERLEVVEQMEESKQAIITLSDTLDKIDSTRKTQSEKDIIEYGRKSCEDLITNKERELKLKEKEEIKEHSYTLSDNRVLSTLKNEEIDLSNANIKERMYLLAEHTGQKVSLDDDVLVSNYNRYATQFRSKLDSLPKSVIRDYKTRYGENWKDAIMDSYKKGWDMQMSQEIEEAYDKGIKTREAIQEKQKKEESEKPVLRPVEVEDKKEDSKEKPKYKLVESKKEAPRKESTEVTVPREIVDQTKELIVTVREQRRTIRDQDREIARLRGVNDGLAMRLSSTEDSLSLSKQEVDNLREELQKERHEKESILLDLEVAKKTQDNLRETIETVKKVFVPTEEEIIPPFTSSETESLKKR